MEDTSIAYAQHLRILEEEMLRPSVLYRPTLTRDGDMYCALYGEDLQEGCAGFGKSPQAAMHDFDSNFGRNMGGDLPARSAQKPYEI